MALIAVSLGACLGGSGVGSGGPAGNVSGMSGASPSDRASDDGDKVAPVDTTEATPSTVAGAPMGPLPEGHCKLEHLSFQDLKAEGREGGRIQVKGYLLCHPVLGEAYAPLKGQVILVSPSEPGQGATVGIDDQGCFEAELAGTDGDRIKLEGRAFGTWEEGLAIETLVASSETITPCAGRANYRYVDTGMRQLEPIEPAEDPPAGGLLMVPRHLPTKSSLAGEAIRRAKEP